MNAKEWLNKKCPDTVSIINGYCPTKIDLALMLESYYQAKSKEEAEERFNQSVESLVGKLNEYDEAERDFENGKEMGLAIKKALKIAAFGKEGE